MNADREFLELWHVDEVIEAVEYSKAGITDARWHAIENELLRLAPRAYCEPIALETIWAFLEPSMQHDIFTAYRADYWPEGTDNAV
jgi:hypothetical protein